MAGRSATLARLKQSPRLPTLPTLEHSGPVAELCAVPAVRGEPTRPTNRLTRRGRGLNSAIQGSRIPRNDRPTTSVLRERLADLPARRKALDAFFADDAGGLQRKCLHRFSGEAFRHARMALNRGEADAAGRFRDYGLSTSSTARLSISWLKLLLKRALHRQSLPAGR